MMKFLTPILTLVLATNGSSQILSQQFTVGDLEPNSSTWNLVETIPQFDVPFSQLESVEIEISGSLGGSSVSISNSGSSDINPSITATGNLSLSTGFSILPEINLTIDASESTTLGPGESATLIASGSNSNSWTFDNPEQLTSFVGTGDFEIDFSVSSPTSFSSNGGSLTSLRLASRTSAQLSATYQYILLGNSSTTPIQPTGNTFSNAPTNNWFEIEGTPILLNAEPGTQFTSIAGISGADSFRIINNETETLIAEGGTLTFTPPTDEFIIVPVNPAENQAIQLEFSNSSGSFSINDIPELPAPDVSIEILNGIPTLTISSTPGERFHVYRSANLNNGFGNEPYLESIPADPGNAFTIVEDSQSSSPRGFYRVEIIDPLLN